MKMNFIIIIKRCTYRVLVDFPDEVGKKPKEKKIPSTFRSMRQVNDETEVLFLFSNRPAAWVGDGEWWTWNHRVVFIPISSTLPTPPFSQ